MPKKKPTDGKPQVHKDLEGLEVEINEFGEIKTNMSADRLNEFLNENVDDKKLRDRTDLPKAESAENASDTEKAESEEEKLFDEEE